MSCYGGKGSVKTRHTHFLCLSAVGLSVQEYLLQCKRCSCTHSRFNKRIRAKHLFVPQRRLASCWRIGFSCFKAIPFKPNPPFHTSREVGLLSCADLLFMLQSQSVKPTSPFSYLERRCRLYCWRTGYVPRQSVLPHSVPFLGNKACCRAMADKSAKTRQHTFYARQRSSEYVPSSA